MDNFFKNCPAVMSDGRQFTDYKTDTRRNEYIKYINNVIRDDDYRVFLQKNGENILDNEWQYNKKQMSCHENECIHKYPTRTLPQYFPKERQAFDDLFAPNRPHQNHTCENYKDYRLSTTYDNDNTTTFQPSQCGSEIKPHDK